MSNSEVLHSYNSLSGVLSSLEREVLQVSERLSKIIESAKDTKSYNELKQGDFKKVYGGVVDEYYFIGSSMARISLNLMDVRTLKRQIQQGIPGLVPSVEKQIRARIDYLVKDYEDLRNALNVSKDVYDAKLRFYQSCQYLMTGSKFTDRS